MDLISESGFYEMEAKRYHDDPVIVPSLSRGIAHTLIAQSPQHACAEHPRLGKIAEVEETAEMAFGDVAHQILLGKGGGIAIAPFKTWRGTDATMFWDDALNAGKTPVLQKNFARATEMVEAVQLKLDRRGLGHAFKGKNNELVAIWQEDDIWCRCMMDAPQFDEGVIYDLKTTTNVHPDAIAKKMTDTGVDMQSVFYPRGVCKLRPNLVGRLRFVTVWVETKYPYAVLVVELNGEFKQLAESKVERAVALWRQCINSKQWPEYSEDIVRIAPKPWAMNAELEARHGASE